MPAGARDLAPWDIPASIRLPADVVLGGEKPTAEFELGGARFQLTAASSDSSAADIDKTKSNLGEVGAVDRAITEAGWVLATQSRSAAGAPEYLLTVWRRDAQTLCTARTPASKEALNAAVSTCELLGPR
jgi:hypothetical protein